MTDYNDGKWHGWNGGECPVHPNSRVEVVYLNGLGLICGPHERSAACHRWHAGPPAQTIAFRVIKEHREPREWWIGDDPKRTTNPFFTSLDEARKMGWIGPDDLIHVREVLE